MKKQEKDISHKVIRIECPKCGRMFIRSIDELLEFGSVKCPYCGYEQFLIKKIEKTNLNIDILNSEGTIIGFCKIQNEYYLKIKKRNNNQYAFFPTDEIMMKKYFSGEIKTKELLIPLSEFSFINDCYSNIEFGMKACKENSILNELSKKTKQVKSDGTLDNIADLGRQSVGKEHKSKETIQKMDKALKNNKKQGK